MFDERQGYPALGPIDPSGVRGRIPINRTRPHIETDFSLHLPVYCDRPRIAQMTSNLLGNALTYGDPNEPVGVHASTGEGVLKLWVANKGTPIPSKAMERFFTRAFQIYEELERSNCAER